MGTFLTEDFLLHNEPSRRLFHEYAESMPILDYHCHLIPEDIARNRQYKNLHEIWLAGDHYKWRAMRTAGVDENLITGNASPKEKFMAWAATVPKTIGNPLYHWTHLELRRPFGISDRLLNPESAEYVWDKTEEMLATEEFSSWGIIKQMNVKQVCTTDDPADDLTPHIDLAAKSDLHFSMLPAMRPDEVMAFHDTESYNTYLDQLGKAADKEITDWQDLMDVMDQRHAFFHENGSRLSDHALDCPVYIEASDSEIDTLFKKIRNGQKLSVDEQAKLQTAFMLAMGRLNRKRGWVMQLHIGALRNTNKRMIRELGPDTGFDSIQDSLIAVPLAAYLNRLESESMLPKTIIYTLNPAANEIFGTMLGNFQGDGVVGKMQFGSGWWFNDQKTGMHQQMTTLANLGLLSAFVGMVTDSRSLLSYPRHEYFRRVLCSLIGGWVEAGEAPADYELLGNMVKDISYRNAVNYFQFPAR